MSALPIHNDPAWTNDPAPASSYAASSNVNLQKEAQHKFLIMWVMRIANCGLCVMMSATGALSIGDTSFSAGHLSSLFIALYVMLFAAIWFAFELTQLYPIGALQNPMRRNFGFLYSPLGKSAFIVFIAFLNFGVKMSTHAGMGTWTAVLLCIDGVGSGLLFLKYPDYYPKISDPHAPEEAQGLIAPGQGPSPLR